MEGASDLADGLWNWSNRATPYVPPEPGETTPPPRESVLEGLRKDLAAMRLRLVESLENHRVLDGVLMARPAPPRANVTGVQLRVSRLSVPHEEVLWPFTRDRVRLPGCSPGARTAFVVLRLTSKREELSWIQAAAVSPAIGETRDDAAPAELLDAAGFSEYFRGFLGGESTAGTEDGPPDDPNGKHPPKGTHRASGTRLITLEEILRLLSRHPDAAQDAAMALHRVHRLIGHLPADGHEQQRRFIQDLEHVWRVIATGLGLRQ
jgi:hypothetical protein